MASVLSTHVGAMTNDKLWRAPTPWVSDNAVIQMELLVQMLHGLVGKVNTNMLFPALSLCDSEKGWEKETKTWNGDLMTELRNELLMRHGFISRWHKEYGGGTKTVADLMISGKLKKTWVQIVGCFPYDANEEQEQWFPVVRNSVMGDAGKRGRDEISGKAGLELSNTKRVAVEGDIKGKKNEKGKEMRPPIPRPLKTENDENDGKDN